jgi:hypothetical protein
LDGVSNPEDNPEPTPAPGAPEGDVPAEPEASSTGVIRPRLPFWKRIGGEGLVVSVLIHGLLLVLFAAWVITTITDTATTEPDTFATGSGGGAKGTQPKVFEHKMQPRKAQNLARTASRITSKSATASVALPDLPTTSAPSLMAGLTGGGSSKGFGGGSGGGIGAGKGIGVGNSRNFVGLFGAKFGAVGLSGNFYDLKQTPSNRRTEMWGADPDTIGPHNQRAVDAYVNEVHEFIRGRWSESRLRKFYRAPEQLSATQFFIPNRSANSAPEAYGVAGQVKPSRWVAHYKGRVKAPVTGKFRFVGFSDDLMLVRWEGKTALDAGYFSPSVDGRPVIRSDDPFREYGDFAGRPRIPRVDYLGHAPGTPVAPFMAGPWIDAKAGMDYSMEVVIGETPGGIFFAFLGIEVSTGKREGGAFTGERRVRLFKIGDTELPAEIAGGAGTGWEMNPGDWTFQPPGGGKAR